MSLNRKILPFVLLFLICGTVPAQTIYWDYPKAEATVYFHIEEVDYKQHKHRKSKEFDIRETDPANYDKIKEIVSRALDKYPSQVLNDNVEKIYVYDHFKKGFDGEYIGRHGFFFAVKYDDKGGLDELNFERVIHHELAHRLNMWNTRLLDLNTWKVNNELNYGAKYESNLKWLEFDKNLFSRGFLYSWALTNKLEDFASFGENIFIHQPTFWNAIKEHKPLRNKFNLICEFYGKLHPQFNRDYFLGLHGIEWTITE